MLKKIQVYVIIITIKLMVVVNMRKFKIFYSWQSDLPGNKTRSFIRDCIDEAIELAEESEAIEAERDEATKDTTGSPNIVTTLFSKIDECDLFVADVSICFTGNTNAEKKSPNPNVLLELGYAVKTLGWERVICLCNTDFGDDYPFDIAHNRITTFSLEGKSKKEVTSDVAKIIFLNIRDLRKSKPRAKAGEATHIVGTYDFEDHVVKETLVPIDITQQDGYVLHNEELLEEANRLFAEIIELTKQKGATSISPNTAFDSLRSIDSPITSSPLTDLSKMFMDKEIPVVWENVQTDAELIKKMLGVDVPEDFFFLGELKKVIKSFNPINTPPTLSGSDAEKEKYEKLNQLSYCLYRLDMRKEYLKTFDGMLFIPIAIQNISTMQDENIRVVLNVDCGEIVEPTERLIWRECDGIQGLLCKDDDDENDVGIICELFCLKEDGIVSIENAPYDITQYSPKIPLPTPHGLVYPEKSEKDYALELQEFVATANGYGYFEFNVGNLRPNECKWLSYGMLLKPVDNIIRITYQIHSTHSTGNLSGTLEFTVV